MASPQSASPQSAGSGTADYDPRTDPKRKARSNDPGWQYGFWPEIGNRDLVECVLCGTQVKAGIKRTYARRGSAAATSPIRIDEDGDMEDDNSDEEFVVDDVEVDDYGEIAPVASESDQAGGGGGNSDPFVMDDDFY